MLNYHDILFWLVVSNMALIFHNIWDVILPIDFHIFHRGWNHQPATVVRYKMVWTVNWTDGIQQPHWHAQEMFEDESSAVQTDQGHNDSSPHVWCFMFWQIPDRLTY